MTQEEARALGATNFDLIKDRIFFYKINDEGVWMLLHDRCWYPSARRSLIGTGLI